jgi:molybdenum cofactor biosynthesis enzyme MoaA
VKLLVYNLLNNEKQKFEFSKTDTNTIMPLLSKINILQLQVQLLKSVLFLHCNRIRLTANGKIKNCLFSNSETDVLTPLRNGEAIENLIAFAIKNKKKVRVGMTTIEQVNNPAMHQDNRSKIAIGG